MNDQVNLSSLLQGSVDQIRENGRLVLIYLAVMIPLGAIGLYFEAQAGRVNSGNFNFGLMIDEALLSQGAVAVISVIGAFVAGLLAHYWLLAGLTRRTDAPAFDRFWPYIGMYILSSLAIGFGFILIIIPGIILSVRWMPLLPMVIDRDSGATDAFGDAWAMTDGYGWSIFGAALIMGVLLMIGGAAVGGAGYFFGQFSFLAAGLNAIMEAIFALAFVALAVTVYDQLRDGTEELAEVFE